MKYMEPGTEDLSEDLSREDVATLFAMTNFFVERGTSESPPKFVVVTGGTGAGKTTVRRDRYGSGFVHLDSGEIEAAVVAHFGADHPRLPLYVRMVNDWVSRESLAQRKNIVIELIGDDAEILRVLMDKMKEIGYEVSGEYVYCDLSEAINRHTAAAMTDKDYHSSYFTEDVTLLYLFMHLGLDSEPVYLHKEQKESDRLVVPPVTEPVVKQLNEEAVPTVLNLVVKGIPGAKPLTTKRYHRTLLATGEPDVRGDTKPFRVFCDDMFHYQDPDARLFIGSFATREEAVEKCRAILMETLSNLYEPEMTESALVTQWWSFGEDPWISGPNTTPDGIRFSAANEVPALAKRITEHSGPIAA